jgi:hypothetical protein
MSMRRVVGSKGAEMDDMAYARGLGSVEKALGMNHHVYRVSCDQEDGVHPLESRPKGVRCIVINENGGAAPGPQPFGALRASGGPKKLDPASRRISRKKPHGLASDRAGRGGHQNSSHHEVVSRTSGLIYHEI